jgi:hypothetical protein
MINEAVIERIVRVIDFELVGDYQIIMQFDDGEVKVVDFEPILSGPIFGSLRDPGEFRKARLVSEFGTIEWPNGADIDPAVLYNWDEHVDYIVEKRKANQ